MFAEEQHTAMTDVIANCFIEITTLTVSKQCILPVKHCGMRCKMLQPLEVEKPIYLFIYATECVEVDVFPVGSRSLAVLINGSDVPDNWYLCVRNQRNISSKHGSCTYQM